MLDTAYQFLPTFALEAHLLLSCMYIEVETKDARTLFSAMQRRCVLAGY